MNKIAVVVFFLSALFSPISYGKADQSCQYIVDYTDNLKKEILVLNKLNPLLSALANGQKIPLTAGLEVFQGDELKDEVALKRKKSELSNQLDKNLGFPLISRPAKGQCQEEFSEARSQKSQYDILKRQNIDFKLAFLNKKKESRGALLPLPKTKGDFGSQSDAILEKIEFTEKARQEIETSKNMAEKRVESANSREEKILADALFDLESYRLNIALRSQNWLKEVKSIIEKYDAISIKLKEMEGLDILNTSFSRNDLLLLISKVTVEWRTLIDDGFLVYQLMVDTEKFNGLPSLPEIIKGTISEEKVLLYQEVYKKALLERDAFKSLQRVKVENRLEDFYYLLSRASKVRSDFLTLLDKNHVSLFIANDQYVKDLFREVLAIPFRFLGIGYIKYAAIKGSLDKGLAGIWTIAQNIFALIFVFFIPFVARITSKKVRGQLDSYRLSLLRNRRYTDKIKLQLAILIQRLTPYVPWVLYSGFLSLVESQIKDTILAEMGIIIPILFYIIVYKVFRLAILDILGSLKKLSRVHHQNTKKLMDSTSKMIGFFFLFSFTILYLTLVTVDRGLLYRHIAATMDILGVIICIYAAYRWREYIGPAAKVVLPEKIGLFLESKCQGALGIFYCLPTMGLVLFKIFINSIWDKFADFEFSKKFLAKLYRKKVESIVGDSTPIGGKELPEEYQNIFMGSDLPEDLSPVVGDEKALEKVKKEIEGWISRDEEEQSVAIHGEKGIGKSSLLDRISHEYSDLNIIKMTVPQKVSNRESLASFLAKEMGFEKSENLKKSILEYNKKQEKNTLILVDNAQNLFLGKYGGFEAFYEFVGLVNLKTENLFWCTAFNEYSWAYIKGVVGSSHFLRSEICLNRWSDDAIKNLILSRHKLSDFSLSYDQIILASRSVALATEAVVEAEEQFFRLLWEQSNGNPRVALFLWVNCLVYRGSNTLKVSLPERPNAGKLDILDDTAWFVLAAIAKHENLTRSEVVSTTNLEWQHVAHAIKLGMESKLLHKGSGNRYRLHFTYQYDLLKHLKMKNFIYGLD